MVFQSKEHKINYLKRNNKIIDKEINILIRKYKENAEEILRLKDEK